VFGYTCLVLNAYDGYICLGMNVCDGGIYMFGYTRLDIQPIVYDGYICLDFYVW